MFENLEQLIKTIRERKNSPLDKSYTNIDTIKKESKKYLDIFKDHPYIFNLGHGILPETNPEYVDYLVKYVKNY